MCLVNPFNLNFQRKFSVHKKLGEEEGGLFVRGKREISQTTEFFERYSESQWRQRQVNLSFIYRFNQQKQRNNRRNNNNNGGGEDFDMEG